MNLLWPLLTSMLDFVPSDVVCTLHNDVHVVICLSSHLLLNIS